MECFSALVMPSCTRRKTAASTSEGQLEVLDVDLHVVPGGRGRPGQARQVVHPGGRGLPAPPRSTRTVRRRWDRASETAARATASDSRRCASPPRPSRAISVCSAARVRACPIESCRSRASASRSSWSRASSSIARCRFSSRVTWSVRRRSCRLVRTLWPRAMTAAMSSRWLSELVADHQGRALLGGEPVAGRERQGAQAGDDGGPGVAHLGGRVQGRRDRHRHADRREPRGVVGEEPDRGEAEHQQRMPSTHQHEQAQTDGPQVRQRVERPAVAALAGGDGDRQGEHDPEAQQHVEPSGTHGSASRSG